MSTINDVLDTWENLKIEDKFLAFDLLQKGIVDIQRNALIERLNEAEQNYENGNVVVGSADDLFRSLDEI